MVDVSVIIVSWNTRDILKQCLESLYKETEGLRYEVIVVDNHSSDGTVRMIRKEFPDVRLIKNPENRGFAAANNQGIQASKGEFLLLLNSDTIILNNAVKKVFDFACEQEGAAATGCRVLNKNRTLQRNCFMFPSVLNMFLSTTYLYKLFPENRFFGREQMTWWDMENKKRVDVVTGCFILVRNAAVREVGSLDERFFMYAEETDWCYRFKKSGWEVYYTPDAEIIHLGGQSSKKVREKMIIQLRLSLLDFMKKHHSGLEYRAACFLVFMFFVLRVPYWSLKGLMSSDAIFCRQRKKAYLTACLYLLFPGKFKLG